MNERTFSRNMAMQIAGLKAKALLSCKAKGHEMKPFRDIGITGTADCRRCDCNVVVDADKLVFGGKAVSIVCGSGK